MANLKGTKTEANLMSAFAGESMARNKYTYYASKAKKDGYVQIANIFEETAANEKEHSNDDAFCSSCNRISIMPERRSECTSRTGDPDIHIGKSGDQDRVE